MAYKRPPRGYRRNEHPLPHNCNFVMNFQAEDETKNSSILPLFRMTEAAAAPENIEVNPTNANFAEEAGFSIARESIVPRINLRFSLQMTKGAIETDAMRAIRVNYMPIYTAFLDSLDAEDEKSGNDIETILELQHATDNKDVYPLYANVDLGSDTSSIMLNTVHYGEALADWGLTTAATYESVAFDDGAFFDALQYYSNSGMLKKVVGGWRSIIVTRDRPYIYYSNNYTQPMVKRGNPYTFCGILFHVPQAGSSDQLFAAGDTTAIEHVRMTGRERFDEWNNAFEQAPV